jgi:hypothetical protein
LELFIEVFKRVREQQKNYVAETSKTIYTTPVNYIDMILNFFEIYNSRNKQYQNKINGLEAGVHKLDETEYQVGELEKELL